MTDSPAQIVTQYLKDVGQAVDPIDAAPGLWPMVCGIMPADGPNYMSILNTGAINIQGRIQRTGQQVQQPKAQIMVRGEDEATAYQKAKQIESTLLVVGAQQGGVGWASVFVEGRHYTLAAVNVLVPATFLGVDKDNRRFLFSINITISLRT